MTDEQIIKALECCSSRKNCEENCPYFELKENFFECVRVSTSDAIECIRRQQAEIDRLKANSKATESTLTKALKAIAYHETIDSYDGTENGDVVGTVCHDAYYVILGLKSRVKEARTEAIKEFVNKLKTWHSYAKYDVAGHQQKQIVISEVSLDNLVKEMAGDFDG